ncbi:hypothetical protein VTL71DRAFT_2107 [Oculimacula yallundae]|uniref:Fido domain-containing protein n=1 Tax=Oculimacula yallundae TaxID=86028 RepID=A0ABR4C985_9HELO
MSPPRTPPSNSNNQPSVQPVGFSWMSPRPGNQRSNWSSSQQQQQQQEQPSPTRHGRSGLENPFPDLQISPSRSSTQSSQFKSFRATIRNSRFPNWTSISKATGPPQQVNFTIKMNNGYRQYSTSDPANLANELFRDLSTDILEVRKRMGDSKMSELMSDEITSAMMSLVFSSNLIERAGLGLDATVKICEKIFRGEEVDAKDCDERSSEYAQSLQDLALRNNPATKEHVVRSRREIIQHARALQHIIRKIALEHQPLSEQIIRDTHKILTTGIDAQNGEKSVSSASYGGVYRTVPVMAGETCFVPPAKIGGCMRDFISEYNSDVRKYEEDGLMDPFWLAAKLCDKFVNIHPFLDGNGRMCRLVLNAVLLKYTGIIVSIGEHDGERTEYIGIAKRASNTMEGPGELAVLILKKATQRFKTLKQKMMQK